MTGADKGLMQDLYRIIEQIDGRDLAEFFRSEMEKQSSFEFRSCLLRKLRDAAPTLGGTIATKSALPGNVVTLIAILENAYSGPRHLFQWRSLKTLRPWL